MRLAAIIGLIFVLALPASAQTTGKIAGRVTDANTDDPLPGVNVVIVGTTQGTTTDGDGYYAILNVRPGTYDLRASFIGFTAQVVEGVRVQIDRTTTIDFSLGDEVIEGEEVVITAQRPLVQRDLTSSEASVSSEELAALPVQSFQDVVNLQAGVVEGHFRGGRVGEVAYMVDGIPINDVYDHSYAFQVENNAIQEVAIISGTFNAEYGHAQSGVVNIVTKDGGDSYEGSLSAYAGDYLTRDTDRFQRLDNIAPTDAYEVQGNLSGPIPGLGRYLTFFASGRYVRDDGFLYGRRIVQPVSQGQEEGEEVVVDGRTVFVPALGDSAFVPMNWGEQATGQMKLTARFPGGSRLSVSGLVQRDKGQNYDHLFRYNPDGIPTNYGDSWSATATYSQVLGGSSFADLKAAYFVNNSTSHVYEDPLDARYPRDDALRTLGGNFSFFRGGAQMQHFDRETATAVGKFDFTSQVTRRHQVKAGIEGRMHRLSVIDFAVKNNSGTGFQPDIPPVNTPDHVRYEVEPIEMAAYLQDKLEFDYMVVNVGVRFDYFDSRGEVIEDFTRPMESERRPAEVRWKFSPRIGLAYPLSEQGVVHVSYGHFFQIPPFQYLYTNPDYIYDPEEGLSRAFGFADLEPEKTVAYEVGLQQALTDVIGVNLTAYYKDIRNLLGTRIETIGPGQQHASQRYGRFINRDYGQVRGFIAAIRKRTSDGWGLTVDYTFQVARGNASDPRSVLINEQAGVEPEKQLVPLDWDRRHQLNTSLTIGTPGNWLATVTGKLGSGLPYTPSIADERVGIENSARKPSTASFDLYAIKNLELRGIRTGIFTRIYNLLDARNLVNVYSDTGRDTPNMRYYTGEPQGLNTKDEFLMRPDFYTPPRQVQVGLKVEF